MSFDVACEEQRADNLHNSVTIQDIKHICHVHLRGARDPTWTVIVTDGNQNSWRKDYHGADITKHREKCGMGHWKEYFQAIRLAFLAESVEVFLSGSDKCVVRIKQEAKSLEFKLSRVANASDVRKSIQMVLLKMAQGTSSPLYWKTVANLNAERRRNTGSNSVDPNISFSGSTEFGDDGSPMKKKSKGTSSSSTDLASQRKSRYNNHLNPGDRRTAKATGVMFDNGNNSDDSDSD
eukprot:m.33707 g.33707  ORF g.33707 m.33707 type:complete len:236 (+) comp6468_c0_seq2:222-929(+)